MHITITTRYTARHVMLCARSSTAKDFGKIVSGSFAKRDSITYGMVPGDHVGQFERPHLLGTLIASPRSLPLTCSDHRCLASSPRLVIRNSIADRSTTLGPLSLVVYIAVLPETSVKSPAQLRHQPTPDGPRNFAASPL